MSVCGCPPSSLLARLCLPRGVGVGFVFQFFDLIPTPTVWGNVVLLLELAGADDEGARRWAEAGSGYVETMGYAGSMQGQF